MKEMRRRFDVGQDRMEFTFGRGGFKEEVGIFYKQRKSVCFVLALMIVMAAFWTNVWVWVVFFAIMAMYSAYNGVRIGVVVGVSFALWFLAGIEGWIVPLTWQNQVTGLWCIATLFLLVVRAAGVVQHGVFVPEVEEEADADAGTPTG